MAKGSQPGGCRWIGITYLRSPWSLYQTVLKRTNLEILSKRKEMKTGLFKRRMKFLILQVNSKRIVDSKQIFEQELNVLRKELEETKARLSRIEAMLGITKEEISLDYEYALAQFLQGNKEPLDEYCRKMKERDEQKKA
jgi:hypothetical protein